MAPVEIGISCRVLRGKSLVSRTDREILYNGVYDNAAVGIKRIETEAKLTRVIFDDSQIRGYGSKEEGLGRSVDLTDERKGLRVRFRIYNASAVALTKTHTSASFFLNRPGNEPGPYRVKVTHISPTEAQRRKKALAKERKYCR